MKYLFLTFFHSQIHFSENPYSKNAKHCIYFVHDCSYAGTDANVYVNIVGSHGQTGKIMLIKSQTNKNPFEKGQTDIFSVHGLPVGKIVKIQVGHDNSGFASAWYVDNVSFVTFKYMLFLLAMFFSAQAQMLLSEIQNSLNLKLALPYQKKRCLKYYLGRG